MSEIHAERLAQLRQVTTIESTASSTRIEGAEAHRAVAECIELWYNAERRHSTLGYVSPMQYERQLGRVARAA